MKRAILIYMMLCLITPITIEAKKKKFGENLFWELTDDGTLTISGNGEMPEKKIRSYPWYKKRKLIQNIVIEEGVTSIGNKSFDTREYQFKSITIPNSMKYIGQGNLKGIVRITDIIVWLNIDNHGGYYGNYYSLLVNGNEIKQLIIPNTIRTIKHFAFSNCNSLTSVIIPNSVTSIESDAFINCESLTSVTIPNSVTSIGYSAFDNCNSLTSVTIPNSVTSIGWGTFRLCESLTSVTIPNSVTSIGGFAFEDCESLTSVTIPNSVTSIGEAAFLGCTGLTSIVIPNSVTSIGEAAFKACENLVSISIPKSVTSIGEGAFCTKRVFEWDSSFHYFNGDILMLPDFMLNCENGYGGIHIKAIEKYKKALKYGIVDKNGNLIMAGKEGWKVTTCQLEDFSLYQVEENGKLGLVDGNGTWVIPLDKAYSKIEPAGGNYIRVRDKNYNYGIITANGKEVIPTSRGYSNIGNYNKNNGTFSFTRNRLSGVINTQGVESSVTKLPPSKYDIMSNGGYADATEITNGGKKYFKVSKSGKYGMTDAEGNKIIPTEMEALEQAGEGYLKYKVNGFWGVINYAGKIIIPTDRGYTKIGDYVSFTKRFPYEMNGFKGECDQTGKQISKISTTTSQKQSVSAKESTTQKQEGEQKIIIEHKHDPVPFQEWQACWACGGMGTMGCDNCGGSGTKYIGDRLHRCSRCNGRGIIPCNVCYGNKGQYITVYR